MSSDNKRNINTTEKKPNILLVVLLSILSVALIALMVFIFLNPKQPELEETQQPTETEYLEKWEEGTVHYKGKDYVYNSDLDIYLLMGIDKEGPVEEAEDYVSGGQSDALFLFVMDRETEEVSVISINRNTMTRVETYQANGANTGYTDAQICVQHGFGDGRRVSCGLTEKAVAHLFYNIPIDGYLSINVGAVPILNDSIGGVEITVLNDMVYPEQNIVLTKDEKVTLTGEQAYVYLRGRDTGEFDSSTLRLRRQEQYITAYLEKVEKMISSSSSQLTSIYDELSPYIVTNIEVVTLLEEITSYEYSSERMYTVPGETVMGEKFEEFHVDEDALYELIIDVFYEEVTK